MTENEKLRMRKRDAFNGLLQRLNGTPDLTIKLALAALYLAIAIYLWAQQASVEIPALKHLMRYAIAAYLLLGGAALLLYPIGRRMARDRLQCIGLVNHAGIPPDLLHKCRDSGNPRVTVWEFNNRSIPIDEWEKKRPAIETALGINIVKLAYARGKSRVLVYAVPAGEELPEVLRWNDSCLSRESSVLVLGEGYAGPVTVNLAHVPHILLGGSTGSGKSVLLKLLLMQCIKKYARVFIADFKGGVDFPKVWHEECRLCITEESLLDTLDRLVAALENRKSEFAALGCPDIDWEQIVAETVPAKVKDLNLQAFRMGREAARKSAE